MLYVILEKTGSLYKATSLFDTFLDNNVFTIHKQLCDTDEDFRFGYFSATILLYQRNHIGF